VNGLGERLRFGGQVMKNVAGYDVSRLQVGAFGTLGVLLAVSVRVLPAPPCEQTLVFELAAAEALARCRVWARQPYPITATACADGLLRVRLSGAEPAVAWAAAELGGAVEAETGFWAALRDHRLPFFDRTEARPLWRCSVPAATPEPLARCLVEWGGALRWVRPEDPAAGSRLAGVVRDRGGHARAFDGAFGRRVGAPVTPAEGLYAVRLKQAFDPGGVLNPSLATEPEARRAN
jgi:glycolate oxidase FAD binding subunit